MAYVLIDETYCPYVRERRKKFICDTDTDVATLPACCVGSTAVSIESGKTYMANTSGKWVAFGGGDNGGSGDSGETEQTTITFILGGTECTAEEGMTWAEWIDSSYDTIGDAYIQDGMVFYMGNPLCNLTEDEGQILANAVIVAGHEYDR